MAAPAASLPHSRLGPCLTLPLKGGYHAAGYLDFCSHSASLPGVWWLSALQRARFGSRHPGPWLPTLTFDWSQSAANTCARNGDPAEPASSISDATARENHLRRNAHRAPPGSSSIAAILNAATRSRCIPPYGPIPCGCPTWKSVSSARSAGIATPMSGRCLSGRTWGQAAQILSRLVPASFRNKYWRAGVLGRTLWSITAPSMAFIGDENASSAPAFL